MYGGTKSSAATGVYVGCMWGSEYLEVRPKMRVAWACYCGSTWQSDLAGLNCGHCWADPGFSTSPSCLHTHRKAHVQLCSHSAGASNHRVPPVCCQVLAAGGLSPGAPSATTGNTLPFLVGRVSYTFGLQACPLRCSCAPGSQGTDRSHAPLSATKS